MFGLRNTVVGGVRELRQHPRPPTSTPASATASARVSFADAMLWAVARSAGAAARVYTLDARFPASGIDVRREW